MSYRFLLLLFGSLTLLSSCHVNQRENVNVDSILSEMEDRKFRKVEDAEILEKANNFGQRWRPKIQLQLDSALNSEKSPCELRTTSFDFIQSDKEIIAFGMLHCEKNSILDSKEKMVWDAYEYEVSQKSLPSYDNIQFALNKDTILYSIPVYQMQDSVKNYKGLYTLYMLRKFVVQSIYKKYKSVGGK